MISLNMEKLPECPITNDIKKTPKPYKYKVLGYNNPKSVIEALKRRGNFEEVFF